MLLLCRRHHTFVHEGGVRIVSATPGARRRFDFLLPDGRTVNADAWLTDVHPRSLDKFSPSRRPIGSHSPESQRRRIGPVTPPPDPAGSSPPTPGRDSTSTNAYESSSTS